MAAKRMDLNKRTFLVLSGCTNPLGKSLALQLCRRFASGSLALLLDADAAQLASLQKELQQQLEPSVQLLTGTLSQESAAQVLPDALNAADYADFARAIIVHNEGDAATHGLLEPQSPDDWMAYVQQQLYTPVALNQRWLQCKALCGADVEKLVINVTSSLQVRPLVYSSLLCSCKRARDMYFRVMAAEETHVAVLNYMPGLLDTHVTQCDLNGNVITLAALNVPEKLLALPRVQPLQAALKLINILEEISFVSGHDVDYYDTFVL